MLRHPPSHPSPQPRNTSEFRRYRPTSKNFAGDVMNFEMAAELFSDPQAAALPNDDVATDDQSLRRGVAGTRPLQRHQRPQSPCYTRDGNSERGGASPMANNRFVGIALILLGVLFLLPLVSSVEVPLGQWWPLFLMIVGLASASSGNRRGGLVVIAIAAAFLVYNLGILRFDVSSLWPVALIAIGAAIIFGYWRFGAERVHETGNELNVASFFSGSNQSAAGERFRGGNVSATFGSVELDLRAAAVVDGAATVNANALFGSINLRVPPDWAVDVRSSAAFGSIESKRAEPSDPRARLTVTGSCLFGGILITS